MKEKRKLIISLILIILFIMIVIPSKVNAALQANGNTETTAPLASWLLNIRKMEAVGGTLGLTDTINSSSLLSTAENSNNLDIHMQKNTEYGAMAILSASAYGNPNKIASGGTTTGNKSGIYIKINGERVSAGSLRTNTQYTSANSKYKNLYTTSYVSKVGDAITETKGWHSSNSNNWLFSNDRSGLLRAYSGSIFSYYGGSGINFGPAGDSEPRPSRAVIVVGNGF